MGGGWRRDRGPKNNPLPFDFTRCLGGVAVALYRRARPGDRSRGVRYLALAKRHCQAGHPPPEVAAAADAYDRHSVRHAAALPPAARGANARRDPVLGHPPPGAAPDETRIRGSRIPTVLQTPRGV